MDITNGATIVAYGRDGPSEEKIQIKKMIKSFLNSNPEFSSKLEENHVKGRFIKNLTKHCIKCIDDPLVECQRKIKGFSGRSNSSKIDYAFCWMDTSEGHKYWKNIYKLME